MCVCKLLCVRADTHIYTYIYVCIYIYIYNTYRLKRLRPLPTGLGMGVGGLGRACLDFILESFRVEVGGLEIHQESTSGLAGPKL